MTEFRFEEFVEHWAEIYRPMQHVRGERSKNKRFFLTDTYLGLSDFMINVGVRQSPCVIMESDVEGTFANGLDQPQYTLYFMVRASETQSGFASREAKIEAKGHAKKFLAYLRDCQYKGDQDLQRINLDERMGYQTIGPLYNGWYGVYITIDDVQQYTLCMDKNDYVN